MAGWGPHVIPKNATSGSNSGIATEIFITRIPCPIAGAEYLCVLPNNTKYITIKESTLEATMKLSFNVGGTLVNDYTTVFSGNSWDKSEINLTGKTIYFSCSRPNLTVEVEAWV